ncbi:MAG: SIS domain-containing protein [Fervidicoccaceae archaeon]
MDERSFREHIDRWESLALNGINEGGKVECEMDGRIKRIIFAGMGGSGIVGDFFLDLAHHYSFPFDIYSVKGDYIPFPVSSEDLVVLLSYSGDTMETLSIFNQVRETARVLAVTSGGMLLSLSMASPPACAIKLSKGLFPRLDLPEMLYAVSSFLSKNFGIRFLSRERLLSSLSAFRLDLREEVLNAARSIFGYFPIFFASRPYASVALRLKNDLSENSKIYSSIEIIPEAMHNTIESLWKLRNNHKIFFVAGRHAFGDIFVRAFSEVLGDRIDKVLLRGDDLISELIYGYRLSAYISLELSSLSKVNPVKTEAIDRYKMSLKKILEEN